MRLRQSAFVGCVGLLLVVAVTTVHAAEPDPVTASLGLGGRVITAFGTVMANFESVLRAAGVWLFWALAIIEMGVWAAKKALHDEWELRQIAGLLSWKIMIWGFFFWVLMNSHEILSAIIKGFFYLGSDATGLSKTLDATGLMGVGVETTLAMVKQAGLGPLSFLDRPLIVLTAIVAQLLLLAAFAVTACHLIMAQIEAMFIIAASPVLLSFGALSFTRDIATNVLKHALATGVKILTIYLLAGVMLKLGPEFAKVFEESGKQLFASPGALAEVIAVAGLMTLLAFFVPTIASSMLSGSSGLSGTAALGAAMGAAAAAATGGAAALGLAGTATSALGNAATGGAAGVTGLAKALGAGVSSGLDMGKSGMGAVAHGVGEVAKHGLGLGASAIGNGVNSAKTAFAEKVDNSTGGKIASSIEATRGGSIGGATASQAEPIPDYKQLLDNAAARSSTPSASADAAPAPTTPTTPPSSSGGETRAGSAPRAASDLAGYTPVGMGDASGASIGGPATSDKPRSTLGKLADSAQRALEGTGGLMQQGREHIVDDRTQVAASIDTRAHL